VGDIQTILRRSFGGIFFVIGVFVCPYLIGYFISGKAQKYELYHSYLLVMSLACMVNGLYWFFLDKIPGGRARNHLAVIMTTLIVGEFLLARGVSAATGVSHMGFFGNPHVDAFVFHPSMGGLPRPGYKHERDGMKTSHNSLGMRGEEPGERWKKAKHRIITVGGSTTYDVGNSDENTWAAQLDRLMGDDTAVLNFGVPGQSSAEHVIATSLILSAFKPTTVVFYMGANDVRSSHVKNLRPDYSNFHMRTQYNNLGLDVPYSFFAITYLARQFKLFIPSTVYALSQTADSAGTVSSDVDQRLAEIYDRNARLLAGATRTIGAVPVFVPQVLNKAVWTSEKNFGWNPNVPQKSVPKLNEAFNDIVVKAARETDSLVIESVRTEPWKPSDFVDDYHFSAEGSGKFARHVMVGLKALKKY
jgi:lysophospholipase L1-like esterase